MIQKFGIIGIVFILASCASTAPPVKITTIPTDFDDFQGSRKITREIRVAIDKFDIDNEEIRNNIVGEATVGAFNSKAPIITDEPVDDIFQKAIERGFEKSGFIIVEADSAEYIVNGVIESFHVDEYATGWSLEYSKAYVRYDLLIKDRDGKIVWANTQEAYKPSKKSLEATAYNILTLQSVLQESVESIFKDNSFWNAFDQSI